MASTNQPQQQKETLKKEKKDIATDHKILRLFSSNFFVASRDDLEMVNKLVKFAGWQISDRVCCDFFEAVAANILNRKEEQKKWESLGIKTGQSTSDLASFLRKRTAEHVKTHGVDFTKGEEKLLTEQDKFPCDEVTHKACCRANGFSLVAFSIDVENTIKNSVNVNNRKGLPETQTTPIVAVACIIPGLYLPVAQANDKGLRFLDTFLSGCVPEDVLCHRTPNNEFITAYLKPA